MVKITTTNGSRYDILENQSEYLDVEPGMVVAVESGGIIFAGIKLKDHTRIHMADLVPAGEWSKGRHDRVGKKITILASNDSFLTEIRPMNEARRSGRICEGGKTKGRKKETGQALHDISNTVGHRAGKDKDTSLNC